MGRFVTVVLITWNSAPYLPRCLDGIAGQSWRDLELIHIDNGSGDGSPSRVRERFPSCTQILNGENRGFSAAVNQAARLAKGDFLLLCNPDAYLAADYASRLVEALQNAGPSFGMATGKLLRARGHAIEPTGAIDSLGIRMTRSGRHLDIDALPVPGYPLSPARPLCEVFGVSGAAGMYTKEFINDVTINGEFLDEDFFVYREDADVAWRGRLFGWRAVADPEAVAYHVRLVTPAARRSLPAAINMHSVKNRFLLRLKNEGLYLALRNAPFEIGRDLLVLGAVTTVERSSLPALKWLWKNRKRIREKRRSVQQRRRVSDRQLARWFH